MMAWLDGPSEGLLRIGREQGYLPPYFQKVNAHGIEIHILAAQAVVITVIAMLYAFIPTVSNAYWIFAALATQVYLIMYVLMFIAAVRLRRAQPDHPRGYRAPALTQLRVVGGTVVGGRVPDRLRIPGAAGPHKPAPVRVLIAAGILDSGFSHRCCCTASASRLEARAAQLGSRT